MLLLAICITLTLIMSSVEGKAINGTSPSSNETSFDQHNQTNPNIIQFYDQTIDLSELTLAGDVLFTKQQIDDEESAGDDGGDDNEKRRRRSAGPPTQGVKLWKDGIVPYIFWQMSEHQKMTIKRKMKIIERLSCAKFVEHTFFNRPKYFIAIFSGDRCFSTVGSANFPANIMSLKFPECFGTQTILHELLHALGFYHEQQRLDRDDHVKVNWENILPGQDYNFRKIHTSVTLTEKYNTRSIMHYKSNDFSKNGEPTIECRGGKSCKLGGSRWLRWSDVRQLNSMYNCPARRKC